MPSSETVNTRIIPRPSNEASFTVTPADGVWYHTNTTLTFTAQVYLPIAVSQVVEYYWQFGDGSTAFGQTATHTYKFARQMVTHLRIRTNYGETAWASKVLDLKV